MIVVDPIEADDGVAHDDELSGAPLRVGAAPTALKRTGERRGGEEEGKPGCHAAHGQGDGHDSDLRDIGRLTIANIYMLYANYIYFTM